MESLFPLRVDERVTLEALDERDAPEVFAAVDAERAHLRDWLPWVDATRDAQDVAEFLRAARERLARADGVELAVRVEGHYVGQLGLHRVDRQHETTSVGYWLRRDHTGRGIMTRSLARLLDACFGPMAMHRVELRAATGNLASRAVAERLGFRLEGVLREAQRVGPRRLDLAVYALLAPEWREGSHP